MKQVVVIVNPDTKTFEVVLKWPAFAPIGPRLEKGLKMPTSKATGIGSMDYALIAAKEYDDWLEAQDAGQRTKTAPAKQEHDHYKAEKDFVLKPEEKKPEPPKLIPPPPPEPKPVPPPKKEFIPTPFDEE